MQEIASFVSFSGPKQKQSLQVHVRVPAAASKPALLAHTYNTPSSSIAQQNPPEFSQVPAAASKPHTYTPSSSIAQQNPPGVPSSQVHVRVPAAASKPAQLAHTFTPSSSIAQQNPPEFSQVPAAASKPHTFTPSSSIAQQNPPEFLQVPAAASKPHTYTPSSLSAQQNPPEFSQVPAAASKPHTFTPSSSIAQQHPPEFSQVPAAASKPHTYMYTPSSSIAQQNPPEVPMLDGSDSEMEDVQPQVPIAPSKIKKQLVFTKGAPSTSSGEVQAAHSPGRKYWQPPPSTDDRFQNVPPTNLVGERDFAQLDLLIRVKPAARTVTLESLVMWSNYKTPQLLEGLPVEKKTAYMFRPNP